MTNCKVIRRKAAVNKKACVACGACVISCPKRAINVEKGLYARVDCESCVGCGKCVSTCPASVIHI